MCETCIDTLSTGTSVTTMSIMVTVLSSRKPGKAGLNAIAERNWLQVVAFLRHPSSELGVYLHSGAFL